MGTPTVTPLEATRVACEVCLREVPLSEAMVTEATDYFTYFCGLDCYEQWKHRGESPPAPAEAQRPAP